MQLLAYILGRSALTLLSFLPKWSLQAVAKCIGFLLFRVAAYRQKVIQNNLANALPERSVDERLAIQKDFELQLILVLLETIRSFRLRGEQLREMVEFEGLEIIEQYYSKGQDLIAVLPHYSNWEVAGMAAALVTDYKVQVLYQRLFNPYFDRWMKRARSRMGCHLIEVKQFARALAQKQDGPTVTIMVADQSPGNRNYAYWRPFLHQDTPFHLGPEKLARRFDLPVIYIDIQRLKDHRFKVKIELLQDQSATSAPCAITDQFIERMENQIRQNPSEWLWSHNRWKRSRPEDWSLRYGN